MFLGVLLVSFSLFRPGIARAPRSRFIDNNNKEEENKEDKEII